MVVLITCKNEDDPIKMKELEWLQGYVNFSDVQGQITPSSIVGSGRNSSIYTCSHSCKNKEDSIKNEDARVATRYLPL